MNQLFLNNVIREEIFESIYQLFGITVRDYRQIPLGYKNLKWKIKTDSGDLFVKQYNPIRYPEHVLNGVETALNKQQQLNQLGIPCPNLFSLQGKYILVTPSGERFVLMECCEGDVIKPGTTNVEQMYSLGQIVGKMHHALNATNNVDLSLHWDILSKEMMIENWQKRWHEAIVLNCNETLAALQTQRKIIEETNIEIFSECEKGWGHWDLFVDNILFKSDHVSAILDFDRMHMVYPEFDISRAILSCSLENGYLNSDSVFAFATGYRESNHITKEKLIRSIKLTWWKEADWVRVKKENDSAPSRRFREEMIWVADNWNQLEGMFFVL